ncbi:MAG: hypothetical protein QM516_05650 [Limnohabitans sp.]|jgi:hypothetical protein|nr:hypothetical protein [Limnohabitans sp.]
MKSFYTLEEAAKKLNMTPAGVEAIAATGKLQKVKHEGQDKFRVEQVDLLAARSAPSDAIGLLDDSTAGGAIGLADSGPAMTPPPPAKKVAALDDSVLGLADSTPMGAKSPADSAGGTGISALSGRGKGGDAVEIGLETVGSGSGLLDLTRESEETALGAELIDQVMSGEGDTPAGASGLFDAVTAEPVVAAAPVGTSMVMAEPYDGAWSGVGAGVLIAAFAALTVAALIGVSAAMGAGSTIAASLSGNILAWAGALAGITAVGGIVGFFIGRASE